MLPHAVAVSWGVQEQPQRGPKRELSIEGIVQSAMDIADSEGLAGVSMSKVASSLGFTTMSLYRYVTSKDDLLQLMQDAAADFALPPERSDADWRAELRQWVLTNVALYRLHPWFGDIPIDGVPMTPNNLRFLDWGLRCLRATPLGDHEKLASILLATSFARASGMLERDVAQATGDRSQPAPDYDTALLELVTPERYPNLRPLLESGVYTTNAAADTFDDFEFGLERLLDGIQYFIDRANTDLSDGGQRDGWLSTGGPADSNPTFQEDRRLADIYSRDEKVREAAKRRRDAEIRAREAQKRVKEAAQHEREAVQKAHERAAKQRERDEKAAERANNAGTR